MGENKKREREKRHMMFIGQSVRIGEREIMGCEGQPDKGKWRKEKKMTQRQKVNDK